MFGGILITNLADVVRRPVDHALAELVSTIALRLFLAMSMLSLKLWELIPFAGLLAGCQSPSLLKGSGVPTDAPPGYTYGCAVNPAAVACKETAK